MHHNQLCDWFNTIPGSLLLEQEKECLEQLLPGLFGYHLVQVGFMGCLPDSDKVVRTRNSVVVSEGEVGNGRGLKIRGKATSLPIATDTVDVVLLPHTMDFSRDPHQVLREAERILIPEGRIIIIGFNPISLWGAWRLIRKRSGKVPWNGQFVSQHRLRDWLSLLGFEVEIHRELMYLPPLRRAGILQKLGFMESMGKRWWPILGAVYVVQAVKRVSMLTPIEPRWKARASVLQGRAVEPAPRSRVNHG